jgi:histidinol dehydrogenase
MATNTVTRLDPETFAALVRALPSIAVGGQTTELQAGYQLGIQHVLNLLRDGYVTGR